MARACSSWFPLVCVRDEATPTPTGCQSRYPLSPSVRGVGACRLSPHLYMRCMSCMARAFCVTWVGHGTCPHAAKVVSSPCIRETPTLQWSMQGQTDREYVP